MPCGPFGAISDAESKQWMNSNCKHETKFRRAARTLSIQFNYTA